MKSYLLTGLAAVVALPAFGALPPWAQRNTELGAIIKSGSVKNRITSLDKKETSGVIDQVLYKGPIRQGVEYTVSSGEHVIHVQVLYQPAKNPGPTKFTLSVARGTDRLRTAMGPNAAVSYEERSTRFQKVLEKGLLAALNAEEGAPAALKKAGGVVDGITCIFEDTQSSTFRLESGKCTLEVKVTEKGTDTDGKKVYDVLSDKTDCK